MTQPTSIYTVAVVDEENRVSEVLASYRTKRAAAERQSKARKSLRHPETYDIVIWETLLYE